MEGGVVSMGCEPHIGNLDRVKIISLVISKNLVERNLLYGYHEE
jgi:hypothetical protein